MGIKIGQFFHPLVRAAIASGVMAACVANATRADVIFSDDFESGTLGKTVGAAKWYPTKTVSTAISSSNAASGKFSVALTYAGNPDPAGDASAQQAFDLGALYPDVWIQYKLFIPSNYVLRSVSPSNNKFFRIWPNAYEDRQKVGASTYPKSDGTTLIRAEWSVAGGGLGTNGPWGANFITPSDNGKWITVKIHVIAANPTNLGTINIWKNGVLVIENSGTVNSDVTKEPYAYRYGYLQGWANTGFAETTVFNIDDVVIATTEAELTGVSPPDAPDLSVQ